MKAYRIVNREESRSLAEYLSQNKQFLLTMLELIEASRMAIDAPKKAVIHGPYRYVRNPCTSAC